MNQKLINEVKKYVEEHIENFHEQRISKIENMKLREVLKKKNPYLFKAKNLLTAQDIIKTITDAFISSSEETIFGNWLEELAIFVNGKVYGGRKSSTKGIDLEFDDAGVRYIVSIKSGPNWGNSSQVAKMREDFKTAAKTLRTSNSKLIIVAVNGCCYGKNKNSDKGDYFKYCGQEFWKFISGEDTLYTDLIEPLATKAKERNEDFEKSYAMVINKFTKKFLATFCFEDGSIDWEKLVKFNSEKA